MKFLILLTLIISGTSMANTFVEDCHPTSARCAILEDNGSSAWLYLTPAGGEGIEKDAFAYSPILPHQELDRAAIEAGNPPILTRRYASENAIIESPDENSFQFVWSSDGESVALLYKGDPIAMVVSGYEKGFSVALVSKSGFGQAWDQSVYEVVFE